MYLDEYQDLTIATAVYPGSGTGERGAVTYCALKLAGEAGEVAEKIGKYLFRGDSLPEGETIRSVMEKELGDVLWYVARLAAEMGLSLDDVAKVNISKLADRAARGTIKGSGDNR